jgi:sulfur relay (sulfurtransferase) DsrC/TusE family protein
MPKKKKTITRNKTQRYSVSLTEDQFKKVQEIHKILDSFSLTETYRYMIKVVHKDLTKKKNDR